MGLVADSEVINLLVQLVTHLLPPVYQSSVPMIFYGIVGATQEELSDLCPLTVINAV